MFIHSCKDALERIWIWICRFPHRCGYGVHSPTDFFLITSVIYETLPYYAYHELDARGFDPKKPHYRTKTNRLLFRLVNHFRPNTLLEVGTGNGASSAYMKAARPKMKAVLVDEAHTEREIARLRKELKALGRVDFVHLGFTVNFMEVFEEIYPYLHSGSCMVVGFINESEPKKAWWKEVLADERVKVTFDLYQVAILLFDEGRFKENHIVNFL